MSYDFAGGSLKLKGLDSGKIKKKSKKSKKDKEKLSAALSASITSSSDPIFSSDSTTASSSQTSSLPPPRTKTAAEVKFEEIQKQRQRDRIAKTASQSHKERVAEFNRYLENLSEHYDIPKVGPG
ncbi:uncharacterized protein EV422DRAFT_191497 [Fimicolochytrium jonesii]|uniref:uncharacterized protein n=1 Tax=Fimicolochytrium jonesii TaxID=1396493 RepID=UPI0022FDEECD|nr:uncharacterized protein EV422DRAFT_191497 [Fimicolochytrium jonesii]KAI8818141.1 hypothetical protein EV422DRAFT_191497 [Fimicolochytrium jonesii]